ncbi:hypothetical protein FRC11_006914, partial [Ceratobasidium sp. 423]
MTHQITLLEKDMPSGYSQLDAKTAVSEDGRLIISFGNRMSKAFPDSYGAPVHEIGIDETGFRSAPRMNINIMIVGSRGDVQPYLALGKQLQQYGHDVRLSTHETFRKMVKDAGLRFYNIGGDPHELMSYMVRNPGLIPGLESLRNGDIGKKQKMVAEVCWGGLDEDLIRSAGPHVFALGNVPHDWLFQHVSAVCHHGGAGTTAIGLKCGKPTIIVPFFGDQPWWATQIARRGAGPPPLDSKKLTAEAFAVALRIALSPATMRAAEVVGEMIRREDGAQNGVDSFHKHMPLLNMRCDLDPTRVAVWYSPTHEIRLSAFAAQVLCEAGYIDINKLGLHRSREYATHVEASDPVSGTISPAMKILNDFGRGVSKLPTRPGKGMAQIVAAGTFGAQGALQGASEGFANLPRLYGGQVRERKKVNGVGSGMVEGTKSLLFGTYDGINDLFMEPVRGYKENGILGAAAGVGKGTLSATTKPLAGVLQFISQPLEGTAKDVRSLFRKEVGKERIAARYAEGVLAARKASQKEKEILVQAFIERRGRTGTG